MREKPTVGQTLYRLSIGDAARYDKEQKLTPVVVVRVGRKYFEAVEDDGKLSWRNEYYIDSWYGKGSFSRYRLFESEQEWLDSKEVAELNNKIDRFFRKPRKPLALAQLREIDKILSGEQG